MLIEEALRTYLAGNSGVSAIVSGIIYPVVLPQGVQLPALMFQRISGVRVESLQGSSGLAHPIFQIDCFSEQKDGYSQVKALAEVVRLALEGYRGTWSGMSIQGVLFLGDTDLYEDESEVYRVSMDFEIWHVEDRPSF